jgi:hypothetical protein
MPSEDKLIDTLEEYILSGSLEKQEDLIKKQLVGSDVYNFLTFTHEMNKIGGLLEHQTQHGDIDPEQDTQLNSKISELNKLRTKIKKSVKNNIFDSKNPLNFRVDMKLLELVQDTKSRKKICKRLH